MAVLILSDHAGIGCSGSLFRSIIAEVAKVLHQYDRADLGTWLESESCSVQLFCQLDVRGLTPVNQTAFLTAIRPALALAKIREQSSCADSYGASQRLDLLAKLEEQVEATASGIHLRTLPNLNGIEPHNGSKEGPGWLL